MAETQVPTTNHPQAAGLSHTHSQPAKPQPAATPSSRDPSGLTVESLLETIKSDLKIFKSDLETAKTHTETAKAHLKTAKSQLENIKSDLETIKLARGHGVDESVVISPPKEAGSSIARFTSDQVYKKQPKKKKKAIADTASFCATSVADAAGVQTANILSAPPATPPWSFPSDRLCLAGATTSAQVRADRICRW